MRAAVPAYIGQDFSDCPPGHRFGPYFACWNPRDWERADNARTEALADCCRLAPAHREMIDQLVVRQRALADSLGEAARVWTTRSTGPMVTGLGMAHPSENGFAFLQPHGLPYLPGASVKGAVRNAAERLALGIDGQDGCGWDMIAVWLLFGFSDRLPAFEADERDEPKAVREERAWWRQRYLEWVDSENWSSESVEALLTRLGESRSLRPKQFLHALAGGDEDLKLRLQEYAGAGALVFWDVIIRPPAQGLAVDVLTPHYTHYYQRGEPPHDGGQPVPNPFLVVPAGAELTFVVHARNAWLPENLQMQWKPLAEAAFEEAADWSGFGAKTAVGYGAVAVDEGVAVRQEAERAEQTAAARRAAMTPEEAAIDSLQQLLEQARTGQGDASPGSKLSHERKELLAQALKWESPTLQAEAAEVIAASLKLVAWPKKKKADRNRQLEQLRNRD